MVESRIVIWRMSTIQKMITMRNIERKITEAKALKHGTSRSLTRRKMSFLLHLQSLPIGQLQIITTPGPETTIWTPTNSSFQLSKLVLFVVSAFYFGWDVCQACEEGGKTKGRLQIS